MSHSVAASTTTGMRATKRKEVSVQTAAHVFAFAAYLNELMNKTKHHKVAMTVTIILLVAAVGLSFFVYTLFQHPTATTPITNTTTLLTTTLTQQGYDKRCTDTFAQTADALLEFENRALASGGELDAVNQNAGLAQQTVSADTMDFVKQAYALCEETGGKYDITLGAVEDLWGFGTDQPTVPSEAQIESFLEGTGYKGVTFHDEKSKIGLTNMATKLSFPGYQEGYEVDYAQTQAKNAGIETALISSGTTVAAYGSKPDGTGYPVSLPDPSDPYNLGQLGVIELADCAVSYCSTATQAFTANGGRYWDILDPATGFPAQSGLTMVAVCAPTASEAAVLARSFFVQGVDAVNQNLDTYQIVALTDSGEVLVSPSVTLCYT